MSARTNILALSPHARPGTVAYHEHIAACQRIARRGNGAPDFARAIGALLTGWAEYAEAYRARYSDPSDPAPYTVLDDGVLGPAWEGIGNHLRDLLDGEVGGLDCGSIDANILDCMARNGAEVE